MTQTGLSAADPTLCPLCGKPNDCQMCEAPSEASRVQVPCWCVDAKFPPALLDRLPESAKGKACICANCVSQAGKKAVS